MERGNMWIVIFVILGIIVIGVVLQLSGAIDFFWWTAFSPLDNYALTTGSRLGII